MPDYDAKILDIELKYFTTSNYNKFTNEIIGNKVKEITLLNKSDVSGFIDNSNVNKNITTLNNKSRIKSRAKKSPSFKRLIQIISVV